MTNTANVPCPACDDTFEVPFHYEPEERETWGYAGGTPYYPEVIELAEEDITCPYCGHIATFEETQDIEHYIRRNKPEPERDTYDY
jgi:uncharacterized Zn-finger protein